ncbi:glycosyltransferase family 39 protein [Hymenobacter sp. BT491]|nr:glycosyltransferase family 39 protein [Hymenobacter sp. BT491]
MKFAEMPRSLPVVGSRLPVLFAVVKFATGFLSINPAYELHRDEYLYLNYGRHLAWGYLEVPPLLAAQSWVTLALGGGYFWVKFWPLLWGSLTVYVVVRLAQRLGGNTWAQLLAGCCFLFSAFSRLHLLYQPNAFEVFGFTLSTYLLVRLVQPDARPRHLYALGITLGLAVLNKYTTFFFVAALLPALFLTPLRRLLTTRSFWLAAGLGLLVCGPNLWWQVSHGLPFRHHMALLRESQLVHVSLADFWKDQLLMCFPALIVWVPGLWAALRGRPAPEARCVGILYVAGLLILSVLHGKSYYALGYYPALFSVGAVWWQATLARRPRLGWMLRPVLLAIPFLLLLPGFPYFLPAFSPSEMERLGHVPFYQKSGATRWEDGQLHPLPQDYADMLGWQELADKAWLAYQALPDSTRAATLIKCDNYGQAGAINYYNRHRAMPAATSFNGSYATWFPDPPARPYRHLLLVGEGYPNDLIPYFQSLRKVGEITNPYAREKGTTIYLGTGPSAALLDRVQRERQQALAAWQGGFGK